MAGEDPRYFQKIFVDENVGFAVFTTELIPSGTSICRYKRDCISLSKAKERERERRGTITIHQWDRTCSTESINVWMLQVNRGTVTQ